MAAARVRQHAEPASDAPDTRRGPRIVHGPRRQGGAIRWDRVGRIGLLIVLVTILALYVGPARSYFATRGQAAKQHSVVERLERENARLKARAKALKDNAGLEAEARRLGMTRPGERAYVVKGLPGGP